MKSMTKHTVLMGGVKEYVDRFGELWGHILFLFNETGTLQTCKTFLFHPAPQLLPLYLFILPPYQMILTMTSHIEHGK